MFLNPVQNETNIIFTSRNFDFFFFFSLMFDRGERTTSTSKGCSITVFLTLVYESVDCFF